MGRFHLWMTVVLFLPCAAHPSASEKLKALVDSAWLFKLKEDPLFATQAGNHQYNDQLPIITEADGKRRHVFHKSTLASLDNISQQNLTMDERITYDALRREIEHAIGKYEFGAYLMPFNADSGFYTEWVYTMNRMPLETLMDYENYITRLKGFKVYMDQQITLMRVGLDSGISQPRVILESPEKSIESHIVANVTESHFYKPFIQYPSAIPQAERIRLKKAAMEAIRDSVIPAYKTFHGFLRDEYQQKARNKIGVSSLPKGSAYYAHLVKYYTTLDMSAEDIHRIGVEEVKRIRAEMHSILEQLGFEGDLQEFILFLRKDLRFYAVSAEALLKEARDIAKRMDAQLPRLFKTFPRMPYGVEAVPDDIAPHYTEGRYVTSSPGSTRPGYYWVNTYALEQRPLYSLTALTLHEAVPGHHFQVSLAQEMESIPMFRRFVYIPAFGEGWGLYSEKLGIEVGMYRDLYSHFGRLTYEMWRACRLVVDTGIHALGWTREQTIKYMEENTALSLHNIRTETDRYISWPGQALAYKMGELKILELRRKAETSLGDQFNIREFHHAVLKNGPLSLPLLEQQIDDYILKTKQGSDNGR